MTLAALLAVAAALTAGAARGRTNLPALPLWPLAGFLALALLQLVPLPPPLHRLIAPGSFSLWHPADPAAAEVLGTGSHPVSLDPATTLAALALVFGLCLLAVLASTRLADPRAGAWAVAVVALGGFALSAYAILARARFGALLYGRIAVPTTAPFGPFVSKNHFAGWSEMAALVAAGLALGLADAARRRSGDWTTDRRAGAVILALVAALAMALASLASLSRGGALALAAGALCLLGLRLARARGRGAIAATLVSALGLGGILAVIVPSEAHDRMRSLSGASFRLDTWKDTLRLSATSPVVGQGLGAFHDAYPRVKRGHGILRVEHSENDYLETLAETGLVGLGLALAAAGLLSARVASGASAADAVVRGIGQGALAALIALFVHSCVDFNLRIPSNAALAALAAALAAAVLGPRTGYLSRPLAAALALGALALAALVARPPDAPWLAARAELEAAESSTLPAARRMRLERSESELRRALRSRPAHAESWLLLAYTQQALGRRDTAAAFARHALGLDPQRPGLAEAVERIAGPP
jgi:O-antigen ligase